MKIDGHVHIFPPELIARREDFLTRDCRFDRLYSNPKARMVGADDVLAEMDATGVDKSVLAGFAFEDQGLCRLANDIVIEAVKAHPDRFIGLASVSPEAPGAIEEVERCLEAGLAGCGELVPGSSGFGPEWQVMADFLEERQAPLLLHANEQLGHDYPGKEVFPIEEFARLAAAYPELTIVLAHLGGGLLFYELMPEMRGTLARVHYDTSAAPYLYSPEIYSVAVTCAGPDKIIFGSDFPLLSPGRYFEAIDQLPVGARAAVLGGNAARVYGR